MDETEVNSKIALVAVIVDLMRLRQHDTYEAPKDQELLNIMINDLIQPFHPSLKKVGEDGNVIHVDFT